MLLIWRLAQLAFPVGETRPFRGYLYGYLGVTLQRLAGVSCETHSNEASVKRAWEKGGTY